MKTQKIGKRNIKLSLLKKKTWGKDSLYMKDPTSEPSSHRGIFCYSGSMDIGMYMRKCCPPPLVGYRDFVDKVCSLNDQACLSGGEHCNWLGGFHCGSLGEFFMDKREGGSKACDTPTQYNPNLN